MPVIVAGRIVDLFVSKEIISSGSADLIALGRTLLAEPQSFPRKVQKNCCDEMIPCVLLWLACKDVKNKEAGVSRISFPQLAYVDMFNRVLNEHTPKNNTYDSYTKPRLVRCYRRSLLFIYSNNSG